MRKGTDVQLHSSSNQMEEERRDTFLNEGEKKKSGIKRYGERERNEEIRRKEKEKLRMLVTSKKVLQAFVLQGNSNEK